MNEIIDIHTHLGDILNTDGENLIHKEGVEKKLLFDSLSFWELFTYRRFGVLDHAQLLMKPFAIRAERARNLTATLENHINSMEEVGITSSVCLPIPPYLNFEALKSVSNIEKRIVPFTGVDFEAGGDIDLRLRRDVKEGARGLKLHPNIQKRSYTSNDFYQAVESFMPHNLPVLIHCGSSSYYTFKERKRENPSYGGDIGAAEKLIRDFPSVPFIVGHSGLFQVKSVISILSKYKNVRVDTSFLSPLIIRKTIKAFGPDKVLFGSDWPFGTRKTAIKAVEMACKEDISLKRRILYENAAEILNMTLSS